MKPRGRAELDTVLREAVVSLEDLLTVEDVARILKLKPATVRAYAERGSLPSVFLGNRLRFKPSDVGLWIERRYRKGGS